LAIFSAAVLGVFSWYLRTPKNDTG